MNKFINHAAMVEDKKGKYPFIIANTNKDNKRGIHWWSILDIEPRNDIFFFDSFGLDGLKHFIIQDDKKIIDKILIGIEQMNRTDQKITLCKIKNCRKKKLIHLATPLENFSILFKRLK